MKTVISLAAAVVLALSAVPATSGDMFQALSMIPAGERGHLTALTDDQLAAIEGENILVLIRFLLAINPENAATLTSQILIYIQNQLNIESTPTVPRNVKGVSQRKTGPTPHAQSNVVEVIQRNIGPTLNAQSNVVEVIQQNIAATLNAQSNVAEVTQQSGNTRSFTRQGM
jgi:hypothetical protein